MARKIWIASIYGEGKGKRFFVNDSTDAAHYVSDKPIGEFFAMFHKSEYVEVPAPKTWKDVTTSVLTIMSDRVFMLDEYPGNLLYPPHRFVLPVGHRAFFDGGGLHIEKEIEG